MADSKHTPWKMRDSFTSEFAYAHVYSDGNARIGVFRKKEDAAKAIAAVNERAELLEALKECADGLGEEIEHHFKDTKDRYPSEMRRYERDIAPVNRARALLAKAAS